MKKVMCPLCKGEGKVSAIIVGAFGNERTGLGVKCKPCDGTGEVTEKQALRIEMTKYGIRIFQCDEHSSYRSREVV